MTYNFPLGSDHDDRDFIRLQRDLLTQPRSQQRSRSWRRSPHPLRNLRRRIAGHDL
jgi:hypothetical protein